MGRANYNMSHGILPVHTGLLKKEAPSLQFGDQPISSSPAVLQGH